MRSGHNCMVRASFCSCQAASSLAVFRVTASSDRSSAADKDGLTVMSLLQTISDPIRPAFDPPTTGVPFLLAAEPTTSRLAEPAETVVERIAPVGARSNDDPHDAKCERVSRTRRGAQPECPALSIKSVRLTRYAGVARPRLQFFDFNRSVADYRLPLPLA